MDFAEFGSELLRMPNNERIAEGGGVYDADRFVRCQWCGSWINARNSSSLFEHRGPLPHPIKADMA
jgi:hypothetical protein